MKLKHIVAYMKCAKAFAECSNATRLKVGTVIVKDNRIISCGYNAQPEHITAPCETEDGVTSPTLRHSEKNALMGLTRSNQSAVGASVFCTHSCCLFCAVDLVDAGVKEFYYLFDYRELDGVQHLRENGVKVIQLKEGEQNDSTV